MTLESDKILVFQVFAQWKFQVGEEIKLGSIAGLIPLDPVALDYVLGDMLKCDEICIVNKINFALTQQGYTRTIKYDKARS